MFIPLLVDQMGNDFAWAHAGREAPLSCDSDGECRGGGGEERG